MSEGQVTGSAAEVYERLFVPAIFHEPARFVAKAAGITPGMSVLDVACGTGILAREAGRLGARVVGLDRNEGMLAVARKVAPPEIEFRAGTAEALPFTGGSFDAVVSQFGLMFFEDRVGALREMARVARPGARIVVAVWDGLERSPGYARMNALLARLFGAGLAAELEAPFVLGDPALLADLFGRAGLTARVEPLPVTARFPSLDVWLETDIRGWTLADKVNDEQFEELRRAARTELADLVTADGAVEFPDPALVATAGVS